VYILRYLWSFVDLWKESLMLNQMIGLLWTIETTSCETEGWGTKQSHHNYCIFLIATMGLRCFHSVTCFVKVSKQEWIFPKDVYMKDICRHSLHFFWIGQNIVVVRNCPRVLNKTDSSTYLVNERWTLIPWHHMKLVTWIYWFNLNCDFCWCLY